MLRLRRIHVPGAPSRRQLDCALCAGVLKPLIGMDQCCAPRPLPEAGLKHRCSSPISRRGQLSLAKQMFGGLMCLQDAGVCGIEVTPEAVLVRNSGGLHERPVEVLSAIRTGDVAIGRAPPSPFSLRHAACYSCCLLFCACTLRACLTPAAACLETLHLPELSHTLHVPAD